MNKANLIIIFLIICLFNINNVYAANCDNETQVEINAAAANIIMDYKVETKVLDNRDNSIHEELKPEEMEINENSPYHLSDFMTLNVRNITDKVYVVFSSNADNINETYYYEDLQNGSFTYDIESTDIIRDFTLTIYSNVGECIGEEINKIEILTPKFNSYSNLSLCENNDAYYCKRYVTTDIEIPEEVFDNYADANDEEKTIEEENPEATNNLIIWEIILSVIAIVIALIMVIIIIMKKRQKKKQYIGGSI